MLGRPLQEQVDQFDGEMDRQIVIRRGRLRRHDFVEATLGFLLVFPEVDLLALACGPCLIPQFADQGTTMRLEMAAVNSVRR
jgi:hypothetical protein